MAVRKLTVDSHQTDIPPGTTFAFETGEAEAIFWLFPWPGFPPSLYGSPTQ